MSLDRVTQAIQARLAEFTGLDARIKFDFGDGTALTIDATATPPTLVDAASDAAQEADCTIGLSTDALEGMIAGTLSPTVAFMTGKLKITGSMGLAMRVAALIED